MSQFSIVLTGDSTRARRRPACRNSVCRKEMTWECKRAEMREMNPNHEGLSQSHGMRENAAKPVRRMPRVEVANNVGPHEPDSADLPCITAAVSRRACTWCGLARAASSGTR